MENGNQASGGERRLAWSGELTLASAQQLHAALLENLERSATVVLDLAQVTEVDVACLQVLMSAERCFAARGLLLRTLPAPAIEQAWRDAGYPRGE